MVRHGAKPAEKRIGIDSRALTAAILFVFLIISFIGCINTPPDTPLAHFLLLCTLAFLFSSSLFLFSWAIHHNQRERLEKLKHEAPPVFNLNEDYRARHDVSDVIIFAIMGCGLSFVAMVILTGEHWIMGSICLALALFGLVMLYKSLFFSVLFTDKMIEVKMKPFISYSEPYEAVTAIHFMPNNRRIIFANGKSVDLGYGIGDSRGITAILKKHVHVVPEERWHWI